MRIVRENVPIVNNYTIDDLFRYKRTHQKVNGIVIKYHDEDGVVIDLGNNIYGYMKPSDFEDSTDVSKGTIISFIGRTIVAYIDDIVEGKIYLNRATIQREYKESFLASLEKGRVLDTEVLSIAPFGLFVDLGYGVLGLLPIGDISIARFPDIFEIFSVGDPIKVAYKGISEKGYIVTHKELLGTWEENLSEFKPGAYCQGIIRDLKPYGVFIELTPNLTGLAEIPKHLNLEIGDSVCVKLKSINPDKLKVKLNIISKSSNEYKLKYKYKVEDGILSDWYYTPLSSIKVIKTIF